MNKSCGLGIAIFSLLSLVSAMRSDRNGSMWFQGYMSGCMFFIGIYVWSGK